MKLTYPLKDKQLKRYLNATEHYAINEQPSAELSEKETGGFFPLGRNDFWHAGIHLDGDQPVHAIAKGKVVAYRVTDRLIDPSELTIQFKEPADKIRKIIEFPISSNFIVTKHTFPLSQGDFFQFYLLYMHLLPRQELSDAQKKALPLFHQNIVTVKPFSNPDGGGLSLVDENLKEIIVMPKDSLATVLDGTCLANGYVPVSIQIYGQSYTGYADFLTKGNVSTYSDLVKTDPKAKTNTGKYGDRVKITTKLRPNKAKTGLNIRQDLHSAAPVIDVAPTGAILQFEAPGEITTQDRKLVVFPPNDSYKKITGYLWQNTSYKIEGYVYVHDEYLQVEQRYQPVLDKVENPRDLEIQVGDVLGWTSQDGTSAKKKTVHLELFINWERDLNKLRTYTKEHLEKNPELKKQKLLQLDSKNLLLEADISQAYQKTRFVTDISDLYEKAVEEAIKSYTMAEAVAEQCVAPDFRRMVVKHHTEWLPNDKDEKIKKRLEEPPYFWPPEKINAYKELYFKKLGFWHLLNESTTPDSEFGGVPYPDEVYYFHPIKFIEHLKLLEPKITLEAHNKRGKTTSYPKVYGLYDDKGERIHRGSLKSGKSSYSDFNLYQNGNYHVWSDESVGDKVKYIMGVAYRRVSISEKFNLPAIYMKLLIPDWQTVIKEHWELPVNSATRNKAMAKYETFNAKYLKASFKIYDLVEPGDIFYIPLDPILPSTNLITLTNIPDMDSKGTVIKRLVEYEVWFVKGTEWGHADEHALNHNPDINLPIGNPRIRGKYKASVTFYNDSETKQFEAIYDYIITDTDFAMNESLAWSAARVFGSMSFPNNVKAKDIADSYTEYFDVYAGSLGIGDWVSVSPSLFYGRPDRKYNFHYWSGGSLAGGIGVGGIPWPIQGSVFSTFYTLVDDSIKIIKWED